MKTQVAIIGAGPAGLLLSHILHLHGIHSVILERQSATHALGRIRAGVLEQGVVNILHEAGLGGRLKKEGMPHHAIDISRQGVRHRIDLLEMTNGSQVTVYGQTELVRDIYQARESVSADMEFEAEVIRIENVDCDSPRVIFRQNGEEKMLECDFVAGCDGFKGPSKNAIPQPVLRKYEKTYPYSWLGILAEAPPSNDVVIYGHHDRGFALLSMRSPKVSRLYIQIDNSESIEDWSDEAIWDELDLRLGANQYGKLTRGKVFDKGITAMRSFVAVPMSHGRLFLAGDAGHIVPPTGAKGLNAAVADICVLSKAFIDHYKAQDNKILEHYSEVVLRRIWMVERFSWHTTTMMHTDKRHDDFERELQKAELEFLFTNRAAQKAWAENYVGLPIEYRPEL